MRDCSWRVALTRSLSKAQDAECETAAGASRSPVRGAKPRMQNARLQLTRCVHPFAEQNPGCLLVGSDCCLLFPSWAHPYSLKACSSDGDHLVVFD
jgi:hypothetical protein